MIVPEPLSSDLRRTMTRVYTKTFANLELLPPGVGQPLIKPRSIDDVPILALTLTGEGLSPLELRRDGRVRVAPRGEQEDAARVTIEPLVDTEVVGAEVLAKARHQIVGPPRVRGLRRHARRFVDHDQIRVSVQDPRVVERRPHARAVHDPRSLASQRGTRSESSPGFARRHLRRAAEEPGDPPSRCTMPSTPANVRSLRPDRTREKVKRIQ